MRPAALVVGLGLALVPGAALLTAGAASAATQASIYCPSSSGAAGATPSTASGDCGETVSSDTSSSVAAVVVSAYDLSNCDALLEAGCAQVTLTLASPSGSDAGPWTYSTAKATNGHYPQKGSLSGQIPADAPNGTYSATVSIGTSTAVTETIPVEVAPATPTDLVASADGTNQVALSWDESAAASDVSFPIDYAGGTPTSASPATLGENCTATSAEAYTCSDVISSVSGPEAFQVSGTRPQSPDSSGTVNSSGAATSDTVDVAGVSNPSPTASSPTSGGGNSPQPTNSAPASGAGSTGSGSGTTGTATTGNSGSATGTSTGTTSGTASGTGAATNGDSSGASSATEAHLASEGLAAAGFQSFTPPSGNAAIDPAPQVAGGSTSTPGYYANGEPIAQGTYNPTLTYPNQSTTQKVVTKTLGAPTYTDVSATTTNTRLLLSFVAGALIVLLVGAHLLAFSRRQAARVQY